MTPPDSSLSGGAVGGVKQIKVAVSTHEREGRKPLVMAYTLWYSPTWPGLCMHTVEAKNGTEAKRIAITQHKHHCMEKSHV